MKRLREVGGVFVLAAMIFGPALLAAGQTPQTSQPGQTAGQAKPAAGGFPDLVAALKSTPGCLGVETARTSSGKQVIFAWFENKKAVLNWYYSDTHQSVKKMFSPGSGGRTPMADVPDDDNPVLAIASLTPTATPGAAPGGGMPFAVSQIAIELYRPLPGGVAAGGRFGPAAMKVPGLIDVPMPAPPKSQQ
jgi:heme-degrading monooxygenase HmoA